MEVIYALGALVKSILIIAAVIVVAAALTKPTEESVAKYAKQFLSDDDINYKKHCIKTLLSAGGSKREQKKRRMHLSVSLAHGSIPPHHRSYLFLKDMADLSATSNKTPCCKFV
jgi:hypothetical protein